MDKTQHYWDDVRLQFDVLPYPNRPLEQHPGRDSNYLVQHNIVIPYYQRYHRVIDTQDRWILDAGCGSGFKLLALAIANPGAHLIGIDISSKSLELAQKRLEYHKIPNPAEFHCMPVEELSELDYTFDYINCDDVLYLLPDSAAGLRAMASVLKPDGIIRANMHSALQRGAYYRAQQFLAHLGCLEGAPTQEEIALTRDTMKALNDWVLTKKQTWKPDHETDDERLLANFLLRGDRGVTMLDVSTMIRQANLEFISMVNWRQWDLEKLFKSVEDLPIAVALGIADMSLEEQLHLFELLHPVHRLLDFYCGHPGRGRSRPEPAEWSDDMWRHATVHLHPQLRTQPFREILQHGAEKLGLIQVEKFLPFNGDQPYLIDSSCATCLYPLLEQPQVMATLVERWLTIRPRDLITLEPADPAQAFKTLRDFLTDLEKAGYVMVELPEASQG